MDPNHALYLTSQRLARRLTGHTDRCGCQECTLYGKLLGSDEGLRRAVAVTVIVANQAGPQNSDGKQALQELTGETL